MLSIKNVCKGFGEIQVLNSVNAEFNTGLNFILGPSGSGKSTLLKIISGMDKEFIGEVFYNGKSLKEFNNSDLEDYYYNSIGFIWQGFNTIDYLSVKDNIKLVLDLCSMKEEEKEKKVQEIINKLSLTAVAEKKTRDLSGGQKQRVAIARAIVKNPDIIIADEPTGALDKKTGQSIMKIFRELAKEKTVIIVTHDKSLVSEESKCYRIYKGNIETLQDGKNEVERENHKVLKKAKPSLNLKNAFSQSMKNFKGMALKFILTSIILVFTSNFLILGFSGGIKSEQDKIFDELIESKGKTLLDISVVAEFMSAAGGNSENKQDVHIKQDVSSIMKEYEDDPRIEYIYVSDVVSNMTISIDGIVDNYNVENSNNVPVVQEVVEGRLPKKDGREVAVTELFVKNLGLTPKDVIGKKISIVGEGFDRGIEQYVEVKAEELTIVGVVDGSFTVENNTGKYEIELEDSFVFGMDVCKSLREQSNKSLTNISFVMRAKNMYDLLEIVDELNAQGIVPIGKFESIKDIVNLDTTTEEQSSSISNIIGALSAIIILAITFINGYLRKREYAILKVNGFTRVSIFNLTLMEYILMATISVVLFLISSPVVNALSSSMIDIDGKLPIGVALIFAQAVLMSIVVHLYAYKVDISTNLSTGDK